MRQQHVRPACRGDATDIVAIDEVVAPKSCLAPLCRNEVLLHLRRLHHYGLVLEQRRSDRGEWLAVGFALYAARGDTLHLTRLGVHPYHRFAGAGGMLLQRVLRATAELGCARLTAEVPLTQETVPLCRWLARRGLASRLVGEDVRFTWAADCPSKCAVS